MRRTLRWGFALLCDAAVFAGTWWLCQVVLDISQSDAIAIAGVVAGLALAPFGWWAGREPAPAPAESARDRLVDRLATAVYEQWDQAATARRLQSPEAIAVRWRQPTKPVAGSAAAAAAATRFPPVPGVDATGQKPLRKGALGDLHALYAGLRSGRLVIVGPPGAGKSGAAVLLVLQALAHRSKVADPAKVPVPVLFTLRDWDPGTQPVQDWLVAQLRQTYDGLFAGRRGARSAAALLRTDKITVILDGFDEIVEPLRPLALQALSEQAVFRLVVLSRTAEIVDATAQTILEGAVAVELQDVDPDTAAAYLTRVQLDPPPHRWRELTDQLRSAPNGPLARALSNPLTITLVRDTYRSGDTVGELLDFCASTKRDITREDIVDHLLDRVLPQAYRERPGHPLPRYSLATAQHTLQLIAARMSQENTRDLAWWRIPTWTSALPRALTIGAASGLAVWLGFGLGVTFDLFVPTGQLAGLIGLVSGLGGMLGAWSASRNVSHTAPTRWHYVFSRPLLVFILGLVFGFLFQYLLDGWLTVWFGVGFAPDIVMWLVLGLAAGLGIWMAGKARLRTPARWRLVFERPAMAFALGLGLGNAVSLATAEFLHGRGLEYGLELVAMLSIVLGLRFGLGRSGEGSVSALTPFASWRRWRASALGVWFGLGLTSWLLVLEGPNLIPLFGSGFGAESGFGFAIVSGLMLGLIYPETWTTSLASAQLTIQQRTPIQLVRFLDDARERGVLRTVGPLYQFRHARLQDRLAELHPTTPTTGPHLDLVGLDFVDPNTAADYLGHVQSDPAPDQWQDLIKRLRSAPASPLARALSNPSTLTLVHDTYRDSDSVRDFLDFCDTTDNLSQEAVDNYLLDRVLPQAYRERPGHPPPRYSLSTAQHTLRVIAAHMSQQNTRDLAWWRIPTWTSALPLALTIGAETGLAVWLGFGLLYRSFWLTFFGNLVGLSSGLGGMLGAWLASKTTLQTAPARWRLMFSNPFLMFVAGVVFGFMLTFDAIRIIPAVLLIGLCYGLLAGLTIWLTIGLIIRLTGKTRGRTALGRWRSVYGPPVVFGLGLGFIVADQLSYLSVSAVFFGNVVVALFALGAGLRLGLGSLGQNLPSPQLSPFASWRQHRVAGVAIWFVLGGLGGGFLVRAGIRGWSLLGSPAPHLARPIVLGIGLLAGFILGLIYPETWRTSLASAHLAVQRRTPLQLMQFLDDARERGVLCASDSIYQFRHAHLQDRLAKLNTTPTSGDTKPDQLVSPASSTLPASPSTTSDP